MTLALPAGVEVDRASVEALVSASRLSRFELDERHLRIWIAALSPGQTFAAPITVIPTIAGALQSGPQTLSMEGIEVALPPAIWSVR